MKYTMFKLLLLLAVFPVLAQSGVKGTVIDAITTETLPQVQVSIEGTNFGVETNALGEFMLTENLKFGEQILTVRKNGYLVRRLPVVLKEGQMLDLDKITMEVDVSAEQQAIGLISLSDNEVSGDDDDSSSYNVSGLLSAGRDAFLNAAAFDFSATFFRPRGLDNANGKLLINGIEMNKQFNGRPQWGNWGGINDVQRNREFSMGLSPNEYSFGGVAGTTNIIMRASQERQGGRISYAAANRSYLGFETGTKGRGRVLLDRDRRVAVDEVSPHAHGAGRRYALNEDIVGDRKVPVSLVGRLRPELVLHPRQPPRLARVVDALADHEAATDRQLWWANDAIGRLESGLVARFDVGGAKR